MHDSAGTSDSAASSGESSSPPASSDDRQAHDAQGLRVDFYILDESSAAARLKLACRLAEKAYLSAQTALVWHTDAEELKAFDDMLWTFMDGSFVPHEMLTASASTDETPVLLSAGTAPPADVDIIINLAPDVPGCLSRTRRIAEIIDGDDSRRRAGRARFKAYRDLGIQPASHNVRG
ncbi:MAG: polymerase chi subunit superfamily protein [Gammaproteobacteria bacterium]|jgi:DNA polymerase-3 subunit chi|nr:polymerase chi subunit superfamily protein [Gammaproteobacteria bacterium]